MVNGEPSRRTLLLSSKHANRHTSETEDDALLRNLVYNKIAARFSSFGSLTSKGASASRLAVKPGPCRRQHANQQANISIRPNNGARKLRRPLVVLPLRLGGGR